MYGPWRGGDSRLYRALGGLGVTRKADGGGSFGYGKAGLIQGSRARIVIAYSCFEERPDDPDVTRRLLGVTYWGQHDTDDGSFTGMARFGRRLRDVREPLVNDAADRVAEELGLTLRSAANPDEIGSTLLLIEPEMKAADLETAVNRNWWPAIEDPNQRFHVEIQTATGTTFPKPKQDTELRTFINAYEAITSGVPPSQIAASSNRKLFDLRHGKLSLIADPHGWSFPAASGADDDSARDESLVALLRKPRMVVEYWRPNYRSAAPVVRGAFLANDLADRPLRETEPYGHDAWEEHASGDADDGPHEFARSLKRALKSRITKFRKILKPPKPPTTGAPLPIFSTLIKELFEGRGLSAPLPGTTGAAGTGGSGGTGAGGGRGPLASARDLVIEQPGSPAVRPDGPGRVRLEGTVLVGLSQHFKHDRAEVETYIRAQFVEEGRMPKTQAELKCSIPTGFREVAPGRFRGTVSRRTPAKFGYVSRPYGSDVSVRLIAQATVVRARTK